MMTYELCNVLILMKNERGEVLFISFPDINIFEWKIEQCIILFGFSLFRGIGQMIVENKIFSTINIYDFH